MNQEKDLLTREIKFRGKWLGTDEWIYGHYAYFDNFDLMAGHYIVFTDDEGAFHRKRIDPKTLGQYAGLHDRNGKEIYKGDIIKSDVPTELEGDAFVVVYTRGYFGVTNDTFEYEPLMLHSPACEIIGNTTDNPELAEAKL